MFKRLRQKRAASPEAPSAPKSQKEQLEEVRALGIDMLVEVIVADDDQNCVAVRRYENKVFDLDGPPPLPVHGCDVDKCRCVYGWVTPNP